MIAQEAPWGLDEVVSRALKGSYGVLNGFRGSSWPWTTERLDGSQVLGALESLVIH